MNEISSISRFITFILSYRDWVSRALHRECGLYLIEYRILYCLGDAEGASRVSELALALETSPASITLACERLGENGLVSRACTPRSRASLSLTEKGKRAANDADLVIASVYDEFLSPLSPGQRAMVEFGSAVMNRNSNEGNHVLNGALFPAYEMLHAFLHTERLLTAITKDEGLSLSGFRILLEVEHCGNEARPHDLGESLLLSPSNLSYALDRLEFDNLIERRKHPLDKRMRHVAMNAKGRRVFSRAKQRIEETLLDTVRQASTKERYVYRSAIAHVAPHLHRAYR